MDKTFVTPGKLYARLSSEFHDRRPQDCRECRMPMVVSRQVSDENDANWTVEPLSRACEVCRPVVEDVVRRCSAAYDVFDPTSAIFRSRPGTNPFSRSAAQ